MLAYGLEHEEEWLPGRSVTTGDMYVSCLETADLRASGKEKREDGS
jgi:hypothetical protein